MRMVLVSILKKAYFIRLKFSRLIIFKLISYLEGGVYWSKTIRELYVKYYGIEIGIGSYGGCFNPEHIPSGTIIGKYCSIAPTIYIFNANHPLHFVTTHPITYNPNLKFVDKEYIQRNKLIIGNDVWIGQNVIITSNVTRIGNGAIIGAGSVVTKNVNEFEVVAGVPARSIAKRFDSETISKIKKSNWWELDEYKIKSNILLFHNIDSLYEIEKLGKK